MDLKKGGMLHWLWSNRYVTPPQAATKIMAGIAEWRKGRRNGGMAERMAEWQKFDKKTIHTTYYFLYTMVEPFARSSGTDFAI